MANFARRNQKTSPATFVLEHPAPPTTAARWVISGPSHKRPEIFLPSAEHETEAEQPGRWLHVPEPRWMEETGTGVWGVSEFYSSFFLKQTGTMESTARTPSTAREFQDTASPAVVSLYRVVPALIATNDGGATPVKGTGATAGELSGRTIATPAMPATPKQARERRGDADSPRKVPMKKGHRGTLMTGEVMLMNQLGRKGVILRKMM